MKRNACVLLFTLFTLHTAGVRTKKNNSGSFAAVSTNERPRQTRSTNQKFGNTIGVTGLRSPFHLPRLFSLRPTTNQYAPTTIHSAA